MTTPVWIITGLLDSEKTILINQLIEQELDEQDVLVVRFELGETSLTEQKRVKELIFSKNQLEQIPFSITDTITRYIDRHSPNLILVEWNGMEHFHRLEEMLLQFTAKAALSIEKMVYTADNANLKVGIPDAGAAAFSQVTGDDCTYVRLRGHRRNRNDADVLYNCNPNTRAYTSRDRPARALFRFSVGPRHCFLTILTAVMLYMMVFPLLNEVGIPPGRYVSIFLGVFPQAAPSLATGILLSSLIQVCLRTDRIQRRFPEKTLAGQLFAMIAGFRLSICDYAFIPVFKSLVKKGVPMPATMTFMLVPPVINPVVIFSTWHAFSGNYKIVAARCELGILCAILCGLTCLSKPPADYLIGQAMSFRAVRIDYSLPAGTGTWLLRLSLMTRHAQSEFSSVGKFLLIGIFASTLFQDMIPQAMAAGGAEAPWKALLVMVGLAFVLPLYSSSGTVVARSIAGSLPMGTVLGFTVFDPVIDIKNAVILLSGFESGFVIYLFATTFLVCSIVTGVFITRENGGVGI